MAMMHFRIVVPSRKSSEMVFFFEEIQFLSGKKHGKHTRYRDKGIPLFSHDYENGKKNGTHIYWYPYPLDPDNYVSKGDIKYASLWTEINEKAKKKFSGIRTGRI